MPTINRLLGILQKRFKDYILYIFANEVQQFRHYDSTDITKLILSNRRVVKEVLRLAFTHM